MTRALPLLLLAACASPPGLPAPEGPALRTWVEKTTDVGGILVVQLEVDRDADWDLPEPEVQGLTFQTRDAPRIEEVGDEVIVTWRYSFSGEQGMYEIPALKATWTGEQPGSVRSSPLWVDMGVEAPRQDLVDIDEPRRVWTPPYKVLGVLGGLGVLFAGGLWFAFGGTRKAPPPPPREPAHVRALKAWEAARADATLDDHDRALTISRIFREYMEEVLDFPATANTTTETLLHLQGMAFLPEGNVPRAKRLLRATDRVKFADAEARAELFDELDSDLRAFLDSTRPRSWQAEEQA